MMDLENPWDWGREAERPDDEEEEEDEWEEEEDDEDWEEEEEEEEEEDEGKVTKAAAEKKEDKAVKKAEPPKKEEKEEKAEKKDDKAKKAKDEKKKSVKVEKPAGPVDPLKMPRTLFVLGLIVFFLATCSNKSHEAYRLKHTYKAFAYSGAADEPIPPLEPFLVKSTEIDPKTKAEQDEENRKKYGEALEKYHEGEGWKEYLKDKEAWRKEKHENNIRGKEAGLSIIRRSASAGKWALTRFLVAQLGLLLMIIGLAQLFMKADNWERIAAVLILGFAILPILTGHSLAGLHDLGGLGRLLGGGG
jgi:hypothetical protein